MEIATLEELLASREAALHQEAEDRAKLAPLRIDPRGVLRGPLFQWAGANFPNAYVVASFELTPPPVCSDGVLRNSYAYTEFCLGSSMTELMAMLQSRVSGFLLSYSFLGSTLRIHATR